MVAATQNADSVIRASARGPAGRGAGTVVRGRWQPLFGLVTERQFVLQHWVRRFAGLPEQLSQARRFTEVLLADCGPVAADAAWVVGELAANAVKHSLSGVLGGWFTVELTCRPLSVGVRVVDAGGDNEPRIRAADPAAGGVLPEAGVGLYGVSALVSRYGTYRLVDGHRVVWARLTFDSPVSALA